MRILLVEDEVKLQQSLKKVLQSESYAVDTVGTAADALEQADITEYDLIILDVGLPDQDGFYVARTLRSNNTLTPILFLTARDSAADIVEGLDAGGDDYISKPFDYEVLSARIRALWRRGANKAAPDLPVLQVADLQLDPRSQQVARAGKTIQLSAKEYALLEYFVRHTGQVLSKSQLIEHVWDGDLDPFSNVVDVYIGYLRQKIDKAYGQLPALLSTLRGRGYLLQSPKASEKGVEEKGMAEKSQVKEST